MDPADTRKALLTASRAYSRAMRAKTCSIATTNLRLGQRQEQRAREAVREHIPAKLEPRFYSQIQRELLRLQMLLPNAEYNAHLHRLDLCGKTVLQHEREAAEDRVRTKHGPDKAIDRRDRKRPKKRRK